MLLTRYVLKKMREVLSGAGVTSYLYIAPQDATTLFCTIYPYSTTTSYSFTHEFFESVNIQVSIFADNANVEGILDLASTIHDLFLHYEATDGTHKIYCSNIVNQRGPEFLAKENFYQYIMEIEFKTQKDR